MLNGQVELISAKKQTNNVLESIYNNIPFSCFILIKMNICNNVEQLVK